MIDLLKKNVKWVLSDTSEKAFKLLKKFISFEPISWFPDFDLPFEFHTNAFDYAVSGVLV